MEALVQKARQSRLPQVEELERRCQFVQLKNVAHTYNFSPAELEYLPTRKPRGIVRKIIHSGTADSLEDALKVVHSISICPFEDEQGMSMMFTVLYYYKAVNWLQ